MNIKIIRIGFYSNCTIGKMYIDDQDVNIYTLEDKVRGKKILGCTAIPAGHYKVIVDYSNHFRRDLPHILDVPDFEGVRIHPGNTDLNTDGCVLVGLDWNGGDFIGRSRDAFDQIFDKIKTADVVNLEIV